MKSHQTVCVLAHPRSRACVCTLLVTLCLICSAYLVVSELLRNGSYLVSISTDVGPVGQLPSGLVSTTEQRVDYSKCEASSTGNDNHEEIQTNVEKCNEKCRAIGTESLPRGIMSTTSNLEMYPLSGPNSKNNNSKNRTSLLALPVGYPQKKLVNQIVDKFLAQGFVVMLFHYDGVVDEWNDVEWSDRVIHVSAMNQTKWWFAKRFLHPDIVAEYDYVFLWDEDLGVGNFHPQRYLAIVEEEGLEISQPALEPTKSKIHHRITVRNRRSKVHRRYYRFQDGGSGRCDENSSRPPCVGWVEMMAPVFSRAAWRCVWHMIQNDLIHAWGLDKQLGYCAQGGPTIKVGVVDEQYILHLGLPTLGSNLNTHKNANPVGQSSSSNNSSDSESTEVMRVENASNIKRSAIRERSYDEMRTFRSRWDKAAREDECWTDTFVSQPH